MQKKLLVVGNSLAVTLDKPILRMLGIGRNSLLKLSTDGRRIVIEPIQDEGRLKPRELSVADDLDALPVFNELMHNHCINQQRFDALTAQPGRIFAFLGTLQHRLAHSAEDALTIRRLKTCLQLLREKRTWDAAIAETLLRLPATPSVTP